MSEEHQKRCEIVENPIRPSEQEESSSGSQEGENRQNDKSVRISENVEVINTENEEEPINNGDNELKPNEQNEEEQQFQNPNEMPVPPVPTKLSLIHI